MLVVFVDVLLFRPRLNVHFRFSDGRRINSGRRLLREDNFWTPLVKSLRVIEVPGTHDSMVLEPNVRVLVEAVKRSLREGET